MKRVILLLTALIASLSAFAYYGDYSGSNDEMSGFAIFTLIIMIAYIILSVVVLVRWWNMTNQVKEIKEHLINTSENPKLTYLVAIGEVEKANKTALIILVDKLMPMYYDQYDYDKVDTMNKYISGICPKMEKLGIALPDYVKSGEKFIDYMNVLTGNAVPYHSPKPSTITA